MAVVMTACGDGLSERSFENESGSWVLYTKRTAATQRAAEVFGVVYMDPDSGCIYLHQPEFDISYPSVWPAGTVVTEAGLRLSDGRDIRDGESVYGGGGYFDVEEVEGGETLPQAAILDRCPGINNEYGEVAEFDSAARDIRIGE